MAPFRLFKSKKKDPESDDGEAKNKGPEPIRIALLGHTSSGKTVFYAMLYRQLRNDPEIQLSTTSAITEEYLQRVINGLLGRQDAIGDDGED